jgi:hypothetical protein
MGIEDVDKALADALMQNPMMDAEGGEAPTQESVDQMAPEQVLPNNRPVGDMETPNVELMPQ